MMSSQSYHEDMATRTGITDLPHTTIPQYHTPSIGTFHTNIMPYSERNGIHNTHNEFMNDIFQKWERTLAQLYRANKTICNLERTVQQRTESSSGESTLLRKEVVAVSRENLDLHDIIKQKDGFSDKRGGSGKLCTLYCTICFFMNQQKAEMCSLTPRCQA